MATVSFKSNVRIKNYSPAIHWILTILLKIAEELKQPNELVVTSINDSDHGEISPHYKDRAVDVRSKNFASQNLKYLFRQDLELALNQHPTQPSRFRVLFEDEGTSNEHFHIQVRIGASFQ